MADLHSVSVMNVTANDKVQMSNIGEGGHDHMILELPGRVTLFFEGWHNESEANLLGFLDQMHQIRNALIQDISERQGV